MDAAHLYKHRGGDPVKSFPGPNVTFNFPLLFAATDKAVHSLAVGGAIYFFIDYKNNLVTRFTFISTAAL